MKRHGHPWISYGREDMTNGAYCSRFHDGHMTDRDEMVRDGIFFDTLDGRGNGHGFYSSSSLDKYHDHHYYHMYNRGDRGYLSDE